MGVGGGVVARITFKSSDEYTLKLSRLAGRSREVAGKAIYEGAKVVADQIKENLNALPAEKFRYLKDGEKFTGVPKQQKEDLIESFGVTPLDHDRNGIWNVKLGFDGYGSMSTKRYPKGVPNQLLARAIESGSSVREKTPFVRPAVIKIKKKVQEVMDEAIERECKEIFK